MMYRIKTEEEFIKEYGISWKFLILPYYMIFVIKYLYGKQIKKDITKIDEIYISYKEISVYFDIDFDNLYINELIINKNMIIEDEDKINIPNYNPRKIIYEL